MLFWFAKKKKGAHKSHPNCARPQCSCPAYICDAYAAHMRALLGELRHCCARPTCSLVRICEAYASYEETPPATRDVTRICEAYATHTHACLLESFYSKTLFFFLLSKCMQISPKLHFCARYAKISLGDPNLGQISCPGAL